MKMKIQVLYLTGTALLIGAAGVGDSITFDAVGSWTGAVILAVLTGRRRHRLLGVWPGAWRSSRRRRRGCAGTARKLRSQSGAEEENDRHSA